MINGSVTVYKLYEIETIDGNEITEKHYVLAKCVSDIGTHFENQNCLILSLVLIVANVTIPKDCIFSSDAKRILANKVEDNTIIYNTEEALNSIVYIR